MIEDDEPSERPPLLKLGIGLSMLRAALTLSLIVFGLIALAIGAPIAMIASGGDEEAVAGIVLGGFVLGPLLCCFGIVDLAVLLACLGAWRMSRPWLWVLIFLSAISATNFPFGTVVGVITIIGSIQTLERAKP